MELGGDRPLFVTKGIERLRKTQGFPYDGLLECFQCFAKHLLTNLGSKAESFYSFKYRS
jgi:hypothetical protein